ncbi:hypothetical protein MNBD_CHLOROFLEXI01-2539 [hydrothermal vent metagenome]|uniref:Uncharacterized protein n=1 Tax=hydrothermal vent metagenome TaxID=652676 RepID=A0A3B0VKT2_9ZZZZ
MPILLKQVAKKPKLAEIHLRADYAELLCLLHPDNELSMDDILSFFTETADVDENLEVSEDLYISDHDYVELDQAPKDDLWYGKAREWFIHLQYRQQVFGDTYPFYLSEKNDVLQLHNNLTRMQKTYLYLLLASNLRCVEKSVSKKLTDSFEYLAALVTQSYLSSKASVHIFGTSSHIAGGQFSQTTALEKIKELAKQIKESVVIPTEDIEHFKNSSGDAGLDIVAWNVFEDNQKGMMLFFGQCACTMDWKTKQDSSNYARWRNLLTLSIRPINAIFFPFFYRKNNGQWYNSTEFRNSIPIDRLRIIQLAAKYVDEDVPVFNLDNLPFGIVDEAIVLDSAELFY